MDFESHIERPPGFTGSPGFREGFREGFPRSVAALLGASQTDASWRHQAGRATFSRSAVGRHARRGTKPSARDDTESDMQRHQALDTCWAAPTLVPSRAPKLWEFQCPKLCAPGGKDQGHSYVPIVEGENILTTMCSDRIKQGNWQNQLFLDVS